MVEISGNKFYKIYKLKLARRVEDGNVFEMNRAILILCIEEIR
jgi:hypothetical protein